jgi:Fis family transcriptional regulator
MVMTAAERPLLIYVMDRYQGNLSHAAQALGITRFTLRSKLRAHGLIAAPKERTSA